MVSRYGHLRRLQVDFGVVAVLQLGDHDLDVLLAGAGDEEFLGLRIAEEAQHGIFFHQLVDAVAQLVFVGARLGLDGEGDGRLGEGDLRILDRRTFVAQRVAGQGVLQLGDGADIAGVQLVHRNGGLALHGGEVGKLFGAAAGEVLHRGVVLQHAGVDLEERDASGEGIADGLEDVQRERLGVADLARRRARHCWRWRAAFTVPRSTAVGM